MPTRATVGEVGTTCRPTLHLRGVPLSLSAGPISTARLPHLQCSLLRVVRRGIPVNAFSCALRLRLPQTLKNAAAPLFGGGRLLAMVLWRGGAPRESGVQ